ncbi:unnamed protein product [marine sediment metagenome]|uniref:Uncharacterized protein n=1 Tax=marine sediment metagenome TaxID=412755 RepID=X1UPF8_9ZZZZ
MEEKTFTDAVGTGEIDFHKELPRKDVKGIIDKQYRIVDAQVVRDWDGEFGQSNFSLLLIEDIETGEQSTTLCGGRALVKQVQKALDQKALPLLGTITMVEGDNFPYYVIR